MINFVNCDTYSACLDAFAVLAGLFPPKGSLLWNKDLQWQPIPVHTVPIDKDEVFSMRKKCQKYINLFEKTMISDYVKKITSKFYDFFNCVARYTGWGDVEISHVAKLQTNLDVYSSYNRSFIPPWSKFLDKKVLEYLAAVNHQRSTLTPALKRLLTGPFWSNLLAHFDNVVNNIDGTPKFLMLSAHDTTIVSILNCVDAYDFSPPNFGATLIWEMRKNRDGVYYINLFYKKSETQVERMRLGEHGF
ncbi:testicular acid phosphatase homolog [Anoplophora glabripennis]|uniref:testicular acid phosphatase homolog n=1 Tax=Anoplophora glabripennis TaxID=217634 RepID=UPI0008745D04|nr:testicular acid phosphatase homolog [Anoplophora glabripennis]